MDFTCIFFGVLFTVAGFVFACGKGHIHLSAWKNMPQSEKDKIKISPLCRNIGEVIALNGIIFLLKGFWSGFSDHRQKQAVSELTRRMAISHRYFANERGE